MPVRARLCGAGWLVAAGMLTVFWTGCDSGNQCGCTQSDHMPPAAVRTLAIEGGTAGIDYFTLHWTATGDDSTTGTAAAYDLRYRSTDFTSKADWSGATILAGLPTPSPSGSPEVHEVHGLAPGVYYFALKVRDEFENWSGLSNSVSDTMEAPPDTIPPAAVHDLNVNASAATRTSLQLKWTATGDDSTTGRAAAYEVRFNTTGIPGEPDWESATHVPSPPTPSLPAEAESLTVSGLDPATTYYFAIKVVDDAGLHSPLSAAASGTTAEADRWQVNPDGSGNFTRISPAIAAAADLDTIEVAAGTYSDTLSIQNKRLVLLGAGADSCLISHPTQEELVLTISGGASRVLIHGLSFTQETTLCGNAVAITDAAEVVFEDCALYHCGLTCSQSSQITLRHCTIDGQCDYYCDQVIYFLEIASSQAEFENCIFSAETGGRGQITCSEGAGVTFTCCDILVEQEGFEDPLGSDGNFSADPLYSDVEGRDFRLLPGSPCLPEFSAGCGLVGAFGPAE